jgi:hypothetical protein
MNSKTDRRRFPRQPALYSAKYTIESGTYKDSVGDLSAGGIYICTRRTIEKGRRISLRFPVFAFDRRPSVDGIVVRSQDDGFAVKFDNPIHGLICKEAQFAEIFHDGNRAPSG